MDENILTRHPQGKSGVNIRRDKYDAVRESIVESLRANGGMTYTQLANAAEKRLRGEFEGSIPWYVEAVKLDLEAGGIIERMPKTRPQRLRLVDNHRDLH